jgi:hypothetical protein
MRRVPGCALPPGRPTMDQFARDPLIDCLIDWQVWDQDEAGTWVCSASWKTHYGSVWKVSINLLPN